MFLLLVLSLLRGCSLQGIDDQNSTLSIDSSILSGMFQQVPFAFLPFVQEIIGVTFETTIQFHIANFFDLATYAVVGAYDKDALEPAGRVDVSNQRRQFNDTCDIQKLQLYQKTASILAFAYSYTLALPFTLQDTRAILAQWNLGPVFDEMLRSDFIGCDNIQFPWGLAKCYTQEIYEYIQTDGWNMDGSLTHQHNRQGYQDFSFMDDRKNYYPGYQQKQGPKGWRPLLEGNKKGYFTRQEHITPFIGATGRLYGIGGDTCKFMKNRQLGNPHYDYNEEIYASFEATARMAENDTAKMLIEAFDDKVTSLIFYGIEWAAKQGYSEMQFWTLNAALGLAYYDSVILGWREKVRHNLIRPTTVAERLDESVTVETFAGLGQGKQTILAKDWQPYIRVMPHAEYPSGSSCMCQTFSEIMQVVSGYDDIPDFFKPTVLYPAGSSKLEPGITPATDLSVTYSSWSSISTACAQSRLDGGMHFRASIAAGQNLCTGIGPMILNKFQKLTAGDATGSLYNLTDTKIRVCEM